MFYLYRQLSPIRLIIGMEAWTVLRARHPIEIMRGLRIASDDASTRVFPRLSRRTAPSHRARVRFPS